MPNTRIEVECKGGSYYIINVTNLLRRQFDQLELHGDELLDLYYKLQYVIEKKQNESSSN